MHPYYLFKDLVTIFAFLFVYFYLISYYPEYLGDPENNIPGNPLVTPSAIIIIIFIYYNMLEIYNNKKNISKELEKINLINENYNLNKFKKFMCGLFQAEGNIYFEIIENKSNIVIKPKISLSLNSNKENIELLKKFNNIFNNKLLYNIYSIPTSLNQHIKIYSKDWNLIINCLIPFFKNCYGDKARGFYICIKIYILLQKINKFIALKNNNLLIIDYYLKIIHLIYSIVDNNQRKKPIEYYINYIIKIYDINNQYKDYYTINDINNKYSKKYHIYYLNNILKPNIYNKFFKINLYFIWGLFYGDGSLSIELKNNKFLWYIVKMSISQKKTNDNYNLLIIIKNYLLKFNVNFSIQSNDKDYIIITESIQNLKKISDFLILNKNLHFNRKYESQILINLSKFNNQSHYWRISSIIQFLLIKEFNSLKILRKSSFSKSYKYLSISSIIELFKINPDINMLNKYLYYNIENNKYLFPINISINKFKMCFTNYYEKKLDEYFDKIENNKDIFIYHHPNKKSYFVKLPFVNKNKPKVKYSTYINDTFFSIDICKKYRNQEFKLWIKEKNFNQFAYLLKKYYNI